MSKKMDLVGVVMQADTDGVQEEEEFPLVEAVIVLDTQDKSLSSSTTGTGKSINGAQEAATAGGKGGFVNCTAIAAKDVAKDIAVRTVFGEPYGLLSTTRTALGVAWDFATFVLTVKMAKYAVWAGIDTFSTIAAARAWMSVEATYGGTVATSMCGIRAAQMAATISAVGATLPIVCGTMGASAITGAVWTTVRDHRTKRRKETKNDSGTIRMIHTVKTMKEFPNNPDAQANGCRILASEIPSILTHFPGFLKCGPVDVAVKAMMNHSESDNANVQDEGRKFLEALVAQCSESESDMSTLERLGVMGVIGSKKGANEQGNSSTREEFGATNQLDTSGEVKVDPIQAFTNPLSL